MSGLGPKVRGGEVRLTTIIANSVAKVANCTKVKDEKPATRDFTLGEVSRSYFIGVAIAKLAQVC